MWKLGDFDAHRTQGEAVGPYTAQYAPPEVAKAKATGGDVLAHPTMDIFSLGLVALEMLRGTPLIPASSSKEEALRTLGGDGLEDTLREIDTDGALSNEFPSGGGGGLGGFGQLLVK